MLAEKIRRKQITVKPPQSQPQAAAAGSSDANANLDTGAAAGEDCFSEVCLEEEMQQLDTPEDAGWVEKCSEQRFQLDKALG